MAGASTKPRQNEIKPSTLSQEFIYDSDDSMHDAESPPSKPVKTAKQPATNSLKKTSSIMSPQVSVSSSMPRQKTKTAKSGIQESSQKSATMPKLKNGKPAKSADQARKAVTPAPEASDEDSDSSSDGEADFTLSKSSNKVPVAEKKQQTANWGDGDDSTASSDPESGLDSKSDSGSQAEAAAGASSVGEASDDVSMSSLKAHTQTNTASAAKEPTDDEAQESDSQAQRYVTAPVPDFRPPKGFKRVSELKDCLAAEYFTEEGLPEGTELWHITAPADLPIETLQQAFLETSGPGTDSQARIDSTTVAGSCDGADYVLVEDQAPSKLPTLYLPQEIGSYVPSKQKVSKLVHVRRRIVVPEFSPTTAAPQLSTLPKPPPEQPAGLKIRYQPFGVAPSNTGTFASVRPRPQKEASQKGKRKAPTHEDTRKRKKRRKDRIQVEDSQDTVPEVSQLTDPGPANGMVNPGRVEEVSAEDAHTRKKQSKEEKRARKEREKAQKAQETGQALAAERVEKDSVPNGSKKSAVEAVETPEERAQRKAVKKRRKGEKRAKEEAA